MLSVIMSLPRTTAPVISVLASASAPDSHAVVSQHSTDVPALHMLRASVAAAVAAGWRARAVVWPDPHTAACLPGQCGSVARMGGRDVGNGRSVRQRGPLALAAFP